MPQFLSRCVFKNFDLVHSDIYKDKEEHRVFGLEDKG